MAQKTAHGEQERPPVENQAEALVREKTAELAAANARLQEKLAAIQNNLIQTTRELEKAIFKSNQMAADAEVRSYELELEIEKRKQSEAALRESENRYRTIIESIEDGYSELDLHGRFTFCNDAMCRMVGYSWDELAKMKNTDILPPDEKAEVVMVFAKALESGKAVNAHRFNVVHKDGGKCFVEASISLIRDAAGLGTGFRGIVRDVEERRRYEERLIHQAYHDALTGLKNRKAFYERTCEAVAYAGRYGTELGLLYIDIDRFKEVNDSLGHEAGDVLLREIADRLQKNIRQTDIVARLGGDEFAVILNNPDGLQIEVVAGRILRALSRPYAIGGHQIDHVSASIGTARFPEDASDPDTLVRCADMAMYEAKKDRNCCIQWCREKTECYKEG